MQLAISSAEQARVADYASSELNQAREKLAAARTHTDNVGSDQSNFNLSQRRANSVQSYLVSQGIEAFARRR